MSTIHRAIAGGLKACIHDHGPIDRPGIASAVKRIYGALKQVDMVGIHVFKGGVKDGPYLTHYPPITINSNKDKLCKD